MAEEPAERDTRKVVERCPFCRGNEDRTPPEIKRYPDDGDWQIRIVPNLYPVLGDDRSNANIAFGLQQVIGNQDHGIALHEMSRAHLAKLFSVYQQRMAEPYSSGSRLKYLLVFKNFGAAAGASIAHTHSQIIATPVVPEIVQNEVHHSREYQRRYSHCVHCSLIDEALTYEATICDRHSGQRRRKINVGRYVIERGQRFVAIEPFASRFEWEIHMLPLHHEADFLAATPEDMTDFARVLRRTMARLEKVVGGVQYNFFLHSAPHGAEFKGCRDRPRQGANAAVHSHAST
jgi:UDPglucose--hexose-1-phosphate uridylyltransferase